MSEVPSLDGAEVLYADPSIRESRSTSTYTVDGHVWVREFRHWLMPDGKSELLWSPWRRSQEQPAFQNGHTHRVLVYGKLRAERRETLCFDHAYPYSGTVQPVEPETPSAITALYKETNAMLDLEDGTFNMCLVNIYRTGYDCIGAHRDDERVMNNLHDVCCWVTGPAAREIVFRPYGKTEPVLRIKIPSGFYAMRGREFQTNYTHGIPELHSSLFKRMCAAAAVDAARTGFPMPIDDDLEDIPLAHRRAMWLKENTDTVETTIMADASTKRRRCVNAKEAAIREFREWCLDRTSFTLRSFGVPN